MSEVRRWIDYGTSGTMPPIEVVAASDYDALRDEVERLERALQEERGRTEAADQIADGAFAEVERLAREVSDYRDYFDASEPDTRRWPSGNARTETLRQARTAIMSRRLDRTGDADPTPSKCDHSTVIVTGNEERCTCCGRVRIRSTAPTPASPASTTDA